jgi:ribosomal protein S3AE
MTKPIKQNNNDHVATLSKINMCEPTDQIPGNDWAGFVFVLFLCGAIVKKRTSHIYAHVQILARPHAHLHVDIIVFAIFRCISNGLLHMFVPTAAHVLLFLVDG